MFCARSKSRPYQPINFFCATERTTQASDGLWDVMSNQEAVDMVVDIILRQHGEASETNTKATGEVALFPFEDGALHADHDADDEGSGGPFQESAERLAVEAYVRGSTDNIGVCVVAID